MQVRFRCVKIHDEATGKLVQLAAVEALENAEWSDGAGAPDEVRAKAAEFASNLERIKHMGDDDVKKVFGERGTAWRRHQFNDEELGLIAVHEKAIGRADIKVTNPDAYEFFAEGRDYVFDVSEVKG